MRLLHTSDLHLGRALYGARRDGAFEKLLAWLVALIRERSVDCLVVAGDVFDNATPSHAAQALYYKFLCAVRFQTPCRHIVVVGGNHDSPSFLNAPQAILSAIGVTVVGEALAPEEEVVLLRDSEGRPEAVVAAVPFLREGDIRKSIARETDEDKDAQVVAGTRRHYEAAAAAAVSCRNAAGAPDIPLIATGHLFAAHCSCGTQERDLYIGSLGQIPAEVFPPEIDYLALGHLHRAQCLGGNSARRYAGSPLALDFGESQKKSVVLVDIEKAGCTPVIETIEVPAFDRLEQVDGTLEEILSRLRALVSEDEPMFCEVIHDQGAYAPRLAEACREATAGSRVELVRIMSRAVAQNRVATSDRISDVHTITPEAMFALKLSRTEGLADNQKAKLAAAYREVLFDLENENPGQSPEAGSPPAQKLDEQSGAGQMQTAAASAPSDN